MSLGHREGQGRGPWPSRARSARTRGSTRRWLTRSCAAAALAVAIGLAFAARADDASFELRAADATVVVGAQAAISLTIVPAAGKTVSHDGPLRVELAPDDGLGVTRKRYGRHDAADPAADAPRFDLKVKGLSPGDHTLDVDVRFWLCGAKVCRPERTHRAIVVHVTSPAPPDAAPPDAALPPDAGRRR
jgi:hypothetical protein